MSSPDFYEILPADGLDSINLLGDGNLTPPISIYNTSIASSVITISGLPLGLVAMSVNSMLMYSILKTNGEHPATYAIYLHIALCDFLNGVVGVVTASFMLQNKRSPIDPVWANAFCAYFAPLPTCVIRLLLYLMTLMALFRVHILYLPWMRLSKARVYLMILLVYVVAFALRGWLSLTSVKTMALPDGWCIYYTINFTTEDQIYYVLADALPVILCSVGIMLCLTIVRAKVKKIAGPRKFAVNRFTSLGSDFSESTPLIIQSRSGSEEESDTRPIIVAKSIVNNILVLFLVCYSAAIYIEVRHLLMAFRIYDYSYVNFDDPDGPPKFDDISLIIFRLKFSLTIAFSIINPILVFRGSSIFRNNIGELFDVDDFSYIVSNRN